MGVQFLNIKDLEEVREEKNLSNKAIREENKHLKEDVDALFVALADILGGGEV